MRIIHIKDEDMHSPALSLYNEHRESQLIHYYEPDYGIFIAESPKVIMRALDAGYMPISVLTEEKQMALEGKSLMERLEDTDIPVYVGDRALLIGITGFALNRGVLCAMRRRREKTAGELLDALDKEAVRGRAEGEALLYPDGSERGGKVSMKKEKGPADKKNHPVRPLRVVILEEVENPTNIGAIFRSAAALAMDAVLLSPGCCDPLYRRAVRVCMGTVFQIPWGYIPKGEWPEKTMALLKKRGYRTIAMALREDTRLIDDPEILKEEKLAIIMGTEGDGLKDETIQGADYRVRIPMANGVDSLNVAAAASVAFWALGRRN